MWSCESFPEGWVFEATAAQPCDRFLQMDKNITHWVCEGHNAGTTHQFLQAIDNPMSWKWQ